MAKTGTWAGEKGLLGQVSDPSALMHLVGNPVPPPGSAVKWYVAVGIRFPIV